MALLHLGICLYRKAYLFSILFLINGIWASIFLLWIWNPISKCKEVEADLSIVSFNASFFGVDKVFSSNYFSTYSNTSGKELIHWLENRDEDLILVQEFFNDENFEPYHVLEKMKSKGYKYHLLAETRHDNGIDRGLVIFSKHPIQQKGKLFLSDRSVYNGASFVDILFQDDTLRIINVHLESMEIEIGRRNVLNKVLSGLKRFIRASEIRQRQNRWLAESLDQSPHPVILAGDFNDILLSPNLQPIRKRKDDAYRKGGSGFSSTLSKSWLPFRIDHVFIPEELECECFEVLEDVQGSDHFPVKVQLTF